MTAEQRKQLIIRAIDSIADGSAAPAAGRGASSAEAQRRLAQAQELRPELSHGGQLRPGLLSEAESVAEDYLRLVGRLAPNERLVDNMTFTVNGIDGRPTEVSVPRWETVKFLQQQIHGGSGGLIIGGRSVSPSELMYNLWLRDQLGSLTVARGNQPRVQNTVRNAGG